MVGFLVWPTIYNIRNEQRAQLTASNYGEQVGANDRLREDALLQIAAHFHSSVDVGQPTPLDMVRYGLVPRFLDPFDRPELRGGKALSARAGLSSSSALTFTVLETSVS